VLDSEEDELDSGLDVDVLDSLDVDGVWVSVVVVVFAVSTGVVAVSELVAASADVACSVVAWV
jgi:hypothetical protein